MADEDETRKRFVTNIRILCAAMVEKAQSGHPGSCLGLAPLMLELYGSLLFDPDSPRNPDRDISLMSNAHVCAIQYVFNCLIGYIGVEDLKNFRQLHSLTPGHLEKNNFGVEITSEPLGQGVAEAVGFAVAQKRIGSKNMVYCIFGDGCYQEGISQEAFSLAVKLKLNNLIYIYDYNKMTIDGSTDLSMDENVRMRFAALNFSILEVSENDIEKGFFERDFFKTGEKPKIVIFHSVIGAGTDKAGSNAMHGTPLGREGIEKLKFEIETKDDFEILPELQAHFEKLKASVRTRRKNSFVSFPTEKFGVDLSGVIRNETPKPTKLHFKDAINTLPKLPRLFYGSADLSDSVGVKQKDYEPFNEKNRNGNFIHFGVREHAMAAVFNALASFGFVCVAGTFLNFIGYCLPAVRLSAFDSARVVFALSHDSIGVGQDGPTHQPIETLAMLRSIPNLFVFRSCDRVEVFFSLQYALERTGPSCIILSRKPVAPIKTTNFNKASKGAYFVHDDPRSTITILATGSEVPLCMSVADKLSKKEIRASVVSFLSFELFEEQDEEYRKSILRGVVISVEMLSVFGWLKYSEYQIGIDSFGKGGKAGDLMEYFGFTAVKISVRIEEYLNERK